jgi:hypothetical protein
VFDSLLFQLAKAKSKELWTCGGSGRTGALSLDESSPASVLPALRGLCSCYDLVCVSVVKAVVMRIN